VLRERVAGKIALSILAPIFASREQQMKPLAA
jgi:hypothetical protein